MNSRELEACDLGPLTAREAETLLWVASGKSSWEAGSIIGVAESTAIANIKAAAEKLGAANRPHLVARAFCAGILRAGAVLAVVVAIVLRMPNCTYKDAVRPKVRRREDEVAELIVDAQNFQSSRKPNDG